MIIDWEIQQNTEEWIEARRGKPTASSFNKIIGKEGKKSTQRRAYMQKLAGERITGRTDDQFYSNAMERGHQLEESARQLFKMTHKLDVRQPGIIYKDENRRFSCSPDGLCWPFPDQGLEIKCRELAASINYLDTGKLIASDFVQIQGSMMVTGYESWHFWSFCPGLKPFHLIVERDEKYISVLEEAVLEFCDDLDKLVDKIKQ